MHSFFLNKICAFIFLVSAQCIYTAAISQIHRKEAQSLSDANRISAVRKIDDGLYVEQLTNGLYGVMERVTSRNRDAWIAYATQQIQKATKESAHSIARRAMDGVVAFRRVLQAYKTGDINPQLNELWVAYIADIPVTRPVLPQDISQHIHMFVTVMTSPDALLTTNLGIARTVEAAQDIAALKKKKQSNQSMVLHAFTARVMKMRDPKKVYMLTMPTQAMRSIIVKQMPSRAVFVGDNVYKEYVQKAEKDPLTLFLPMN